MAFTAEKDTKEEADNTLDGKSGDFFINFVEK